MNPRRMLRFERGLTARQVTEGAGVSRATLRTFERGGDVSAPIAKAIADFYGITVADLLGVDATERAA